MEEAVGGLGYGDDEDDPKRGFDGEADSITQPFAFLLGPHPNLVRPFLHWREQVLNAH